MTEQTYAPHQQRVIVRTLHVGNIESYAPHQQRVIEEKRELDEKIQKLTAFIYSEKFVSIVSDDDERLRLQQQDEVMRQYSRVLCNRIASF